MVSRELGHWYRDGRMHAKHVVALALEHIFRCSDRELPDELQSRGLSKLLGYKGPPDPSIFSKVRKEVGEQKVGMVAELLIQGIYKDRFVSLVAIDSSYIPYWFDGDVDAVWGACNFEQEGTGSPEGEDAERTQERL